MCKRQAFLMEDTKGCTPVVLALEKKVLQEAVASVSCVCVTAMLRFFFV